jgi:predicted nucleotidyltransferase
MEKPMTDLFDVARIIADDARQRLGDEIALIVYTGSRIKGTHSPNSDLDLYYVPCTQSEAHCTLLYGQLPIDFFPIPWDRLERWANYEEPHASLIVDSQIAYARSDEDRARFEQLKARIFELQQPQHRPLMIRKAIDLFKGVGYHYFLLDAECAQTGLFSFKREAWQIVEIALHALAVMNQTFYRTDCSKNRAEVLALPHRPAQIEEILSTIVESANYETVKTNVRRLLIETKDLLDTQLREISEIIPFAHQFRAYYPEIREQLNKIETACDLCNSQRAFSAIVQIQNEIAAILSQTVDGRSSSDLQPYAAYSAAYEAADLPNLIEFIAPGDFDGLRMAVAGFDRKIRKLLAQNNVPLNRITSTDELNNLDSIWNRL